jgi:hypothetical protein
MGAAHAHPAAEELATTGRRERQSSEDEDKNPSADF